MDLFTELLNSPQGQMMFGGSGRGGYNPITSAVMEFAERAGNAQNDAAFQQWRGTRGIPQDHPVSINEYNRYQRHARQVGRPRWKARRTGDVRELQYQDYSFGLPTDAGMQFFLAAGEEGKPGTYLRPEEVAARAQAQLAGAQVVEIDLTNAENLILVGNVMAGVDNEEAAAVLHGLAKGKAGTRARAFYDKTGTLVIVDNNREVLYNGDVGGTGADAGALAALAADPDRVDIAGTAAGVASGASDNRLMSLDDAPEKGNRFDVGNYVPPGVKVTTQPPMTTVVGEVVNVPGADPRNLYVMMNEGGERKIVPVPILSQQDSKDPKSPWNNVLKGNSRVDGVKEYAQLLGIQDPAQAEREWRGHTRKARRSVRRRGTAAKRARSGSISTGLGQVTAADEWAAPPMKVVLPDDPAETSTGAPQRTQVNPDFDATEGQGWPTDFGAGLRDGRDWQRDLDFSDFDATEGQGWKKEDLAPALRQGESSAYVQFARLGDDPKEGRIYADELEPLTEQIDAAFRSNFPPKWEDMTEEERREARARALQPVPHEIRFPDEKG